MAADNQKPGKAKDEHSAASAKTPSAAPAWSDGLRQLYDSVVDEPLPDSFMDLLNKLDDPSAGSS